MRRSEAQEALQWCMAFTYLAFNPTAAPEVSGALQIRRARFSLDQLRTMRTSQGAQSDMVAGLSKRLMMQPEKFLAEVGLGFDLAHMLLQRHNPQLSETANSAARPIDVELVAPELDQAVQAVRSELIDRYVGLRGSVVRAANIAPLITELNFTCSRCSSEVAVTTVEGRFEYPASCPKKCRFARFTVNRDKCRAIDWQHPSAGGLRRAGGWKQRRRSAAPHASNGGLRFEALVGWFLRTWRCGDGLRHHSLHAHLWWYVSGWRPTSAQQVAIYFVPGGEGRGEQPKA